MIEPLVHGFIGALSYAVLIKISQYLKNKREKEEAKWKQDMALFKEARL